MRHRSIQIILAAFLSLALPAVASAADFSIFIAGFDSSDLDEAFGAGVRVAFDLSESFDFDITGSYFEDFQNQFEDIEDPTDVEVGFIPVDFGVTWFAKPEGGFFAGAGATYAFMDLGGLEVNGVDLPDIGNADDEFGLYAKVGYQIEAGFFGEVMYRDIDVTIEELNDPFFEALGIDSINVDMSGIQLNLGWRF